MQLSQRIILIPEDLMCLSLLSLSNTTSILWMLSRLKASRPEFSCNYQPESARHSLIITDIEWHLPPGQRETCFFDSVNRWPQDGGGCCYYSKYLTENVKCQRPFYPPGELEERSWMLWCGFGAFVLHITLTFHQKLRKSLSNFNICLMEVFIYFFLQLKACQKLNVWDVTCILLTLYEDKP